ncbi:MucR family transcriptional regulator [Limimaricola pyoseonensis]|uniref:MucR family transcriptional regulator n=1 Tax=Limimaricola pyoseonensis TaxID=521013 RepID=UPI000ABF56C8|nr:MucR family transcriptional regulator [Limimaricola pyoseonensis]
MSGTGAGDGSGRGLRPRPAVPVETSVTPDYIICLETGRKLVLLRRHLRERLNLTPEEYRRKWGLPPEYPMAAPNYARKRAQIYP